MRVFKTGHIVLVLLMVTFGLFLATAFGHLAPAPEPGGDIIVTVFTDLPSQPDAPTTGLTPTLGFGWVVMGLGLLCGMGGFVSALRRCGRRTMAA